MMHGMFPCDLVIHVTECKTERDIVIVLDGSNSIYPWDKVTDFLDRLLKNMDIGPKETQVCYGRDSILVFNMRAWGINTF